jgi:hypothetical protein
MMGKRLDRNPFQDHEMPNADFDWDRHLVRKFCKNLIHQMELDNRSTSQYLETFVYSGWSFAKFKYFAEFDFCWLPFMMGLEKLHSLRSFY